MKCPVCETEMIILELEQVEIDYCTFCKGIWLDEGELELLLGSTEESHQLMDTLKQDTATREIPRPCPRCKRKMQKVSFDESNEILLDKCKKGHGLWFDEGELHELVKRVSGGQQTKIVRLLQEMFANDLKNNG